MTVISKPSHGSTGWDDNVNDVIDRVNELQEVDPTSDADKPISTATKTALDLKADTADLADVATSGAYADLTGTPSIPNSPDDIGAQPVDADLTTIAGLTATDGDLMARVAGAWAAFDPADLPVSDDTQAALDLKADTADLADVATSGAYTDLTGTPSIPSAYTDEMARDALGAALVGGTNVTITVDDAGNTITIAASGGGGGGGTVDSVTAADSTITVAGTTADPTVKVNAIAESQVTNLVADLAAKAKAPVVGVKASDQAVNNSTTLVDCTDLAVSLAASTRYRVEFYLPSTGASAQKLKVGLTYPSGMAGRWGPTGGVATSVPGAADISAALALTTNAVTTITGHYLVGIFTTSATAGTLQLKFAQNVAAVNDVVVLAGAFLIATPV